jgi:hypothetical protein
MSKKSTVRSTLPHATGRRAFLHVGRRELCDYVADIASAFGQVASSNDMRFLSLSYLLAMVVEKPSINPASPQTAIRLLKHQHRILRVHSGKGANSVER